MKAAISDRKRLRKPPEYINLVGPILQVVAIHVVIYLFYCAATYHVYQVRYQRVIEERTAMLNAELTESVYRGEEQWLRDHLSAFYQRSNVSHIRFTAGSETQNDIEFGIEKPTNWSYTRPIYNIDKGHLVGEIYVDYPAFTLLNQLIQRNTIATHFFCILLAMLVYYVLLQRTRMVRQRIIGAVAETLSHKPQNLERLEVCENIINDYVASVSQDKSELKSTIEHTKELHLASFDNVRMAMVVVDLDGRIIRANGSFCNQYSPTGEKAVGRYFYQFVAPANRQHFSEVLENTTSFQQEKRINTKLICDGEQEAHGVLLTINHDKLSEERVIFIENRSEIVALRKRLEYALSYEPSTGLLKREGLIDNISGLLRLLDSNRMRVGVIVFRLTALTRIRDLYGIDSVNKILQSIAAVTTRRVSPEVLVGFLGENEIVLVVHAVRNSINNEMVRILTPIKQHLCEPLYINKRPMHVSHTIGICVWPDFASNAEELLQRASLSANSWDLGDSISSIAYNGDSEDGGDQLSVKSILVNAIEEGRIRFDLQPIVSMKTETISMFELFVRLVTHDGVRVPPNDFLEVAEQMNMMGDIVQSMVTTAFEIFSNESDNDGAFLLSMNLSVSQILLPDLFDILVPLRPYRQRVVLEIVNSTEVYHPQVVGVLNKLVGVGYTVASDDCDVSVRSLMKLSQLPVKIIKLDKTFFSVLGDGENRELVVEFFERAQALNKKIVMEGIENEEELQLAREYKSEFAQGYYIGRPKDSLKKAREQGGLINAPNEAQSMDEKKRIENA